MSEDLAVVLGGELAAVGQEELVMSAGDGDEGGQQGQEEAGLSESLRQQVAVERPQLQLEQQGPEVLGGEGCRVDEVPAAGGPLAAGESGAGAQEGVGGSDSGVHGGAALTVLSLEVCGRCRHLQLGLEMKGANSHTHN